MGKTRNREQSDTVTTYLNTDIPLSGLAGRSVLVVDDSPSLCKLIVNILEASGFTVVAADNGDTAMREMQAQSFDMLITDVVMPGTLNGCELVREARNLNPLMAAILTTGNVGDDAIFEMFEAGNPPPLLRKPFRMRELLESVRDAFADKTASLETSQS
jgi:CheY-like chemotaxis protein